MDPVTTSNVTEMEAVMENMTQCDNNITGDVFGPMQVYSVLGSTALVVFSLVPLTIAAMLLYSLHFRPRADHPLRKHILLLQLLPSVQCVLLFPVLLSPAAMELVTMLQDLLTVGAMVIFVDFTLHYSGPLTSIQAPCPLATPPLCCLMCCPKPSVSSTVASLILLPIRVTPVALVLNFLVNLYLIYSGVESDLAGGFFQVSNIHNVLMIPFFVTMMYCFKVFFGLTALKMKGSNPRWRAGLLFQMFALCKAFEGIISMLEVRSVLPCIPGLPSRHMSSMLTALVQMFYLTILVAVLPRLYAKSWIDSFLPKDFSTSQSNGEDSEKTNGESQKMLHEQS